MSKIKTEKNKNIFPVEGFIYVFDESNVENALDSVVEKICFV